MKYCISVKWVDVAGEVVSQTPNAEWNASGITVDTPSMLYPECKEVAISGFWLTETAFVPPSAIRLVEVVEDTRPV